MADVVAFPKPLSRIGSDGRLRRLRELHDGFRVAAEAFEVAFLGGCPRDLQERLWSIAVREAAAAERALAGTPPGAA
jgi:hypothetical protein